MSHVQALENQLAGTKELIARREAALRLYRNKDFQTLILEGFGRDECARYAQQSADPALDQNQRADALAMAQASGHLMRYLSITCQMANAAEGQVQDIEDALAEARADEDSTDHAGTEGDAA